MRRLLAPLLASTLLACGGATTEPTRATDCPAGDAIVAEVWGPEARGNLAAHLSGDGPQDAARDQLLADLDGWMGRYAALQDAACAEGNRNADAERAQRRQACLDSALNARRQLLSSVQNAPAARVLQADPLALAGLPSLDRCASDRAVDRVPLPPTEPGGRDGRLTLERALARAALIAWEQGDAAAGLRKAEAVARQAEQLGQEDLGREARLLELGARLRLQPIDAGLVATAEGLADAALEAGDRDLEARVLLRWWRHLPDREAALSRASQAIEAAGAPLDLRLRFSQVQAPLAIRAGDRTPLGALPSLLDALDAAGHPPGRRAKERLRLGHLLLLSGDTEGARGQAEGALEIARSELVSGGPQRIAVEAGAGELLVTAGAHGPARPLLEDALAFQEATLGPTHPAAQRTRAALLVGLLRDQRVEEAAVLLGPEADEAAPTRALLADRRGDPTARQEALAEAGRTLRGLPGVVARRLAATPDPDALEALALGTRSALHRGIGGACSADAEDACAPGNQCLPAGQGGACAAGACCTPRCASHDDCGLGQNCLEEVCRLPTESP